MCANTDTDTTIVTTLSTQVPKLCRFSTSDALERGGSNGLVVTGVLVLVSQMVFVSKMPKCLESAEMRGGMGNWEICRGIYFPISQKISAHLAQHYLGN